MPQHEFLLYGHRGAAAELPENTMESFARALEAGADALEMDVHLTSDGHVVVSHDGAGGRMGAVDAAICESTLAEVHSWDIGHGFVDAAGRRPHVGKGFRIPTFEEVLVGFADVPLNVDIKQQSPPLVEPLLRLIRRHRSEHRVRLASFSVRTLWAVRNASYRGPTGLARAEVIAVLALPTALLQRLELRGTAAQIPVRIGPFPLATRSVIDKCHALGMRVDFWTISDPAEARRLVALGADGIMTDDPAALAGVLKQSGAG